MTDIVHQTSANPDTAAASRGEFFQFLGVDYDIAKAKRLILPDRPTQRLDVRHTARALNLTQPTAAYAAAGAVRLFTGDVDEDYARTRADLTQPVILGDLNPNQDPSESDPVIWLMDGYHRMRRAYLEGLETMPAYLLTRAEVAQVRLPRGW